MQKDQKGDGIENTLFFIYVLLKSHWKWVATYQGHSESNVKKESCDFYTKYYHDAMGVMISRRSPKQRKKKNI